MWQALCCFGEGQVEAWAVWRAAGGWGLAVFLAALIPTGLFALGWQARLERVRRDVRAFARFLWDRDLLAQLAARRRALVEETASPARLPPPEVLAGGGGSRDPAPGPGAMKDVD